MQRQLIQNGTIDSALALEFHTKAENIAREIAKSLGKADYASDEIIEELETLVNPILMERNLADDDEYNKLHKLIYNWSADNLEPQDQQKCALVQQALLSFMERYRKTIADKFDIFYNILMHDGWIGLAHSKSGNNDKIPDVVNRSREMLVKISPENISFYQKDLMIKMIEEEVSISIKK